MKIQSLAVLFIIIILPISLVLASYTQNKVDTINIQTRYDSKLNDATYDALKAYQLNSFNSDTSDYTNSRIRNIEASANTFFNSMASGFSELGYTKETLQNYVPALVYAMYDGYYIYSPYTNTWDKETQEKVRKQIEQYSEDVDSSYEPSYKGNIDGNVETLYGLKPYVYYSCRYKKEGSFDVTITYSLDNYIQIQGYVMENSNIKTVSQYGYILDKVEYDEGTETIKYNNITINEEQSLEENVYVNGKIDTFKYIKKNGTKYYLDEDKNGDGKGDILGKTGNEFIFSVIKGKAIQQTITTKEEINNSPTTENIQINGMTYYNKKFIQRGSTKYYYDDDNNGDGKGDILGNIGDDTIFSLDLYGGVKQISTVTAYEIKNNNNAKNYYKEAYNLKKFMEKYGLNEITVDNIVKENGEKYEIVDDNSPYHTTGKIFDFDNTKGIESESSNFNSHRTEVIKHSIERNLSIAISNFNRYSSLNFQMPKLRETDWDKIMNNISIISFLQGANIGGKIYNGYAIVTNTKNEDVVMEDSIYIQTNTDAFCRITETGLDSTNCKIGVYNVNIERRTVQESNGNSLYYFPVNGTLSYKSIVTQDNLALGPGQTLSEYIYSLQDDNLKKIYYTALGRERYGLYRQQLVIPKP